MTDAARRAYNADLHKYVKGYAKRKGINVLEVISALSEITDQYLFNIPKPDRVEIHRELTEYAKTKGETLENIYDVMCDVLSQEIDAYIISGND